MNAKQNHKNNAALKIFTVSALVLVIDQTTKLLTKSLMTLRESVPVIGDTLRLTYIENDGMALGIAVSNKLLFNAFSLIAAAVILYYLIKLRNDHFVTRFALAIIFGGAIGNLIDRILYGKVIDFFDLNIPDIPSLNIYFFSTPSFNRWPIFNVADIAVSVGMFILILTVLLSKSPWHYHETAPEPVPAEENERG